MSSTRLLPPGMLIGCKRLGGRDELPWHAHPSTTLCVVFSGGIQEEDDRQVRLRTVGDVVFRPYPEAHRNRPTGRGAGILTLEIDEATMRSLPAIVPKRDSVCFTSPRAARLARLAAVTLRRRSPEVLIELSGLAYELLATVVRDRPGDAGDRPPRWLLRVHDRLRDEFRRTPTLEELASDESVSPFRLSRAFRQHYGCSIGDFLRDLRVEHALSLLAERDLSLVDVALDSGFYDQSHLTNVFRAHTGMTPGEFRKQLRSPIERARETSR